MNAGEIPVAVAAEWVEKAEEDLKTASHTLRLGKDCPAATVCFHAQQCVEKYVKALLAFCSIPFPKTHNIEALLKLVPSGVVVSLTFDEQRTLTLYATVTRYPGDYVPVTIVQAREAVKMARRVRREIRSVLPRRALLRSKT